MISPLNTSPETFPPCSRQGEETPETTVRAPWRTLPSKQNQGKLFQVSSHQEKNMLSLMED